MKLLAPKYYLDFKCIADKCLHSCCKGWEIDVDPHAMDKYRNSKKPYAKAIRESISTEEPPHFMLRADESCPHLDENGLCRIITELGEGCLCDICREHPRFYNTTALGKEVGIGMSCEEACRIILNSDSYAEMITIGKACGRARKSAFIAPVTRETLYSVLSDRSVPYKDRLARIAEEYGMPLDNKSDSEWRELLASLEYLDGKHKAMFSCYSSNPQTAKQLEKPLERALAYFIYRHASSAESEAEFRIAVGLALFLERLTASIVQASVSEVTGAIEEAARIVSEEIEYSEDNTDTILQELWF